MKEILLGNVMVDCADAALLQRFYGELLGWEQRQLYGCPAVRSAGGVVFLFTLRLPGGERSGGRPAGGGAGGGEGKGPVRRRGICHHAGPGGAPVLPVPEIGDIMAAGAGF